MSQHQKTYSPEQRAWFAGYAEVRGLYQPDVCKGGSECWVQHGPPAMATRNGAPCCAGCDAYIPAGRHPQHKAAISARKAEIAAAKEIIASRIRLAQAGVGRRKPGRPSKAERALYP